MVPRTFDPRIVRLHRARSASLGPAAFLVERACEDVVERLGAIQRRFSRVLVIGGGGSFARAAALDPTLDARIGSLVSADPCPALAGAGGLAFDPEALPFADESFDLVVALFVHHWANDLPGAFIQIRRALRPDGLFIGVQFGARTLHELRSSLIEAESEIVGGAGVRVSPFADVQALAGLLGRAGFALPVVDVDAVTARYADPLRLIADLRAMGETAAFAERAPPLRRDVVAQALARYAAAHPAGEGRIAATFEILFVTGWRPHESQQKPLAPGSAKMRLADALGVPEQKPE